jgi:hypothetical protein
VQEPRRAQFLDQFRSENDTGAVSVDDPDIFGAYADFYFAAATRAETLSIERKFAA